ncbi:hypothetical protein DEU56DRAFT_753972 [Suillus clintonianus]|uniref:uncharacterized protein n=1 Tax=Suillus clintonianus TaxID=1904413 RepID=UPI001B87CB8D|nr:uncharacterized protein DEU56DRAFT_753972 [Suillus clintonianus]KAG2145919.1 hypothetical protein DEU56DRAFT_753972 [Suillus clintonianus]
MLPNPIPTNSKQTPPLVNSFNIIGKMTVNQNEYELLKVSFSHQGLIGRGTVCYLDEYIIKDHWVTGGKDVVLNEVKMLEALKGVPGVPRLVEYWLVEMVPDQVDNTQSYRQKIHSSTAGMYRTHIHLVLKPRARPLHEFRSRKELVKALCDIMLVQKCAVEKHNILHRDCSLNNNSMIEDTDNGSRGVLIDWEFTACITSDNLYSAGGTTMAEERKKAMDSSTRQEVPKFRHTYHNDLESVFYVFAWICIMFKGPGGEEHHLEDIDSDLKRADIWLPQ